jgi:hypothetical protein
MGKYSDLSTASPFYLKRHVVVRIASWKGSAIESDIANDLSVDDLVGMECYHFQRNVGLAQNTNVLSACASSGLVYFSSQVAFIIVSICQQQHCDSVGEFYNLY